MPEFDVNILTIRSGTHTVRVVADNAAAARGLAQSECEAGEHCCLPEWCTDDVESTVLNAKEIRPTHVTDEAAG